MFDSTQETVLIVEDDESVTGLQGRTLRKAGYQTLCATSESETLDRLHSNNVDLVILNYRLTYKRTGLDLYADLKAAGYEQPVIIVTDFGDEATVTKALRAGVRDFIKTSDAYLEYLPTAVDRVLSQNRLEKRSARSDEQIRQAQKMEAVGNLAGGVAHDFNNLLTVILGYSDMLKQSLYLGDPLREFVEQIENAGNRAASLTRQLLAFSRKQMLSPVSLDLNALAADMKGMLARLIGEDIELTFVPADTLWRVCVDPGQMEQVIMNLIINARDAMPQGGKLTIETKNVELGCSYASRLPDVSTGEHVLLAVSDTGCGMGRETLAHIFEPFFSMKGELGTGLGLPMVYGIVKQSGGHIMVYSEPQMGTTVKIYLPRDLSGESVSPAPSSTIRQRHGTETILLVEDEDGVRTLARLALQRQGYRVLEACHGGEALLICERHSDVIHLLVTDVVMPHMSGPELGTRLLALRPEMKVLYMSGYTDDAIVRHGLVSAGVPFLQKPYTPDAIAQKVGEALEQSAHVMT